LLVIASLYWAQTFLIPVALALLITFVLAPVSDLLERIGLGRIPSVFLVVVLVFSLLGTIGWFVTIQFASVANQLPTYRSNIRQKIVDIRGAGKGGALEKVQATAKEVKDEFTKDSKAGAKPQEVIVRGTQDDTVWPFSPAGGAIFERLAGAGFVIILAIFMLIRRENLRNRLIRLLGFGHLTLTTKALEEAGERITRYLLMQSIINCSFGLAVGVTLFFVGLPYALLWGVLAALLRFVPYVGAGAAALLPTLLALAVFSGWLWPLLVLAAIVALELLNAMVLEPSLYSDSAGVSEVGVLVAIAFWTWLWGPVGLLLATPLTVCVVVISKYVPQLDFIGVLMSDEEIMNPSMSYYQRLLAMDEVEAAEIVEEQRKEHSQEEVFDDVMIPALSFARRDFLRGTLAEEDEEFVFQATRKILTDLSKPNLVAESSDHSPIGNGAPLAPKITIMGCPARDEADELALIMFDKILDPNRYEMEPLAAESLTSEMIAKVLEKKPTMICIASLPPEGLAQTRALCKRVRLQCPDIKILVGRWGNQSNGSADNLLSAGADKVGATMTESRDQVAQLSQILSR